MKITRKQLQAFGLAPDGKPKAKPRERRPRLRPGPAADPPRPVPTLLALDPSSTAIGWARFASGRLIACGLIRGRSLPLEDRAIDLASRAAALVEGRDDLVVMEGVSGMHRGAYPAAVAAVAFAQGVLWAALAGTCRMERVRENDWTRGPLWKSQRKPKRARTIRLLEPVYDRYVREHDDPGYDIADAIGLGLWRIAQC